MAELIALVSSIAGLADVSAKVAIGLFSLAQAIGSAGQEIRAIAHSTKLISGVLGNLNSVMAGKGKPKTSTMRGDILVEDAVGLCRQILDDCEGVVEIFQPLINKTGRRRERALLRLRMLFERSRFLQHRDALDKLTGILTLHVTVMNFTHITALDVPEETSASFRIQVVSSIATVNDTCQEQKRITQLLEYHGPHMQGLLLTAPITNTPMRHESVVPSLIEFEYDSTSAPPSPATTTQEPPSQDKSGKNNVFVRRHSYIDGDSQDGFSQASGGNSTLNLDDESEATLEQELDLKIEERFASGGLEEFFESHVELKSLQKKTILFAEQVLQPKKEDDLGSEDDVFSDAVEAGDERESAEFHEEVLRLRSVHGQIYSLPFDFVKTWNEMSEALSNIYDYNPEYMMQEKYNDSHDPKTLKPFQLFGPDGNAILSAVWSMVIEPGDLITMRFRDDKLNGIGAHPITVTERGMGWLRSWWSPKDSVGHGKNVPRNGQNRVKLARGPRTVAEWVTGTRSMSSTTGSLSDS